MDGLFILDYVRNLKRPTRFIRLISFLHHWSAENLIAVVYLNALLRDYFGSLLYFKGSTIYEVYITKKLFYTLLLF
jgi:hypothetical protein